MIIECSECGAKNQITQTPQSGKKYRCGKCRAEITLLEVVDAQNPSIEISQKKTRPDKRKEVTKEQKLYICSECGCTLTGNMTCCPQCGRKLALSTSDIRSETTSTPFIPSRSAQAAENTSGQGRLAVVPQEIKGWNWGAFFFGWLWGASHKVWISFLSAIPYVGIIMLIVLGLKGNEWAWRRKEWDNVEHFKRTQRTWAWWALGLFVAGLVYYMLMFSLLPGLYD